MKAKNEMKLDNAKRFLEDKGIMFLELKNGQLQVDRINFWATTDKWYDPIRNIKGIGMNSFIKHLKDNQVI